MIKIGKPQEDPAVFLLYNNMKWGNTVKYTTVIFDLDGTLLNTLEDLQGSVNRAMLLHGFPERSLEEVRQFVGNGIRRLLERCVPDGSHNPAFEQALEDFKTDYGIHCNDKTRPYPGILSMLEAFKAQGMKMAIVSNKADFAVKKLCSIYFDGLIPERGAAEKTGSGHGGAGAKGAWGRKRNGGLCRGFRGRSADRKKQRVILHQRRLGLPEQGVLKSTGGRNFRVFRGRTGKNASVIIR